MGRALLQDSDRRVQLGEDSKVDLSHALGRQARQMIEE
jgi:hypothetical protein